MAKSDNLRRAKELKNDEFYTQLSDIEAEISMHDDYRPHFQGKTVFCNCDDTERSAFYEFFRLHFKQLGLKKLITTHYNPDGFPSYKLEWCGEMLHGDPINLIKTPLNGNGDFRSPECIEFLKEADIVVTNPPFSLFREFVAQLEEYGKKWVIIGNMNAIAYKDFFPLLKNNVVRLGYTSPKAFLQPDGSEKKMGNVVWYTNLDLDKSHESLSLTKNYYGNEERYPRYDNFDAVDVSKVKEIPKDYYGVIGVPITYMANHCKNQFSILALTNSSPTLTDGRLLYGHDTRACIRGCVKYFRILIQRIKSKEETHDAS